jgi:hypothetical protein
MASRCFWLGTWDWSGASGTEKCAQWFLAVATCSKEGGVGRSAVGVGGILGGCWLTRMEAEVGQQHFVLEKTRAQLGAGWFNQWADAAQGWQSKSMRSGTGE